MAADLADFPKEAEVCQELGPNPGGKVFLEQGKVDDSHVRRTSRE